MTARYKTAILPVEAIIRARRLLYVGHVERMGSHRLPYRLLHGEVVGGRRAKGKSERQYRHCIKEDLQKFEIPEKDWQQMALDETVWKAAVREGTKKFLVSWRANRIAARLKAKAGEQRRRRTRGEEVNSPDRPTRRRLAAQHPAPRTIRALGETQSKIPAAQPYQHRRKAQSIVARTIALRKMSVVC